MKVSVIIFLLSSLFSSFAGLAQSRGYLHANGKLIYNGNGEEIILRGIGTGNWLLQEGYMMKTADFAGTMHAFRQKLVETIGIENTNVFYETWLDNHFSRTDVDSMKSWGFNSVRVAMHYKWFTLPIEDEPVTGLDTWLEDGFVRIDSLLQWCSDNQMYLILDLHGAPGGQGHDANISDYDPSKPSLWESAENKRKTIALWGKLAERYASEPWIGGYDLINEPNWDLPGGTALKQLYQQITTAIRAVDQNHMIIIEGNWFANDYTGITAPWDNNMVYSFHKYWNYNTPSSIDWMKNMRNNYNVPIWLGESGENSNSWFTDLIALCETNHIGWSWWPVKKAGINNVLQVPESQSYNNLINYWKNGSPVMTADQAFAAVMEWADNHRIENCEVKRDVIDAMIRQPFSTETIPFRIYKPGEPVHAVNYDLGRCSSAYWDADTANYRLNTNVFVNWNEGWVYRNDGVDIEKCTDSYPGNIGYSVGWTKDNEWLQYTVETDSAAAYTLTFRSATNSVPGIVHLEVDGLSISSPHVLPFTAGWYNWSSSTLNGIILPAGQHKVRMIFDRGGSNFGFFSLTNPVAVNSVPFSFISAASSTTGGQVYVTLNKEITELTPVPSDFQVTASGNPVAVSSIGQHPSMSRVLVVSLENPVEYGQIVRITYSGVTIVSGTQQLEAFSNKDVKNTLPRRFSVPVKIEAEDYYFNNGFQLEDCTDINGGKNVGFANNGDYLDYLVRVPEAGEFTLSFRVASEYSNGRIDIRIGTDGSFSSRGIINFTATGGWQKWTTQSIKVNLPAGNFTLRLYSIGGEYNINWFDIAKPNATGDINLKKSLKIFPNPSNGLFRVYAILDKRTAVKISVSDMAGRIVYAKELPDSDVINEFINLQSVSPGNYLLNVQSDYGSAGTGLLRF